MRSEKPANHPLSSRLWMLAVSVLGLPLIGMSLMHLGEDQNWTWLWLALAVGLTSSLGTRVPLRGLGLGGMTMTASDCITLLALFSLNVWVGIFLAALDATVVVLKMRVKRLDRRVFNLSQMALATWVAGLVSGWLERGLAGGLPQGVELAVVLLLTGAMYYLTNFLLITVAMVLFCGGSLVEVWARNLPFISPALALNLLAGVGFLLPILVPTAPELMWGMVVAALGLIASVFYSRRLAHVSPLLLA